MLLSQSVIYFRLTPLIALKNRFGDLALMIGHKSPSASDKVADPQFVG
jgi:hypothetical protein